MALIGIITGLKAEADILRPSDLLIESCGGHQEATRIAIQKLAEQGATHLVSFGIAGGLSPHLKSGDLIFPKELILPDGKILPVAPLSSDSSYSMAGRMAGISAPVLTAAEKSALFSATGAWAADTESHLVAQSGLPFSIIRAIADIADQDLPPAILQGLDEKGRALIGPILFSLCKAPWQLPGLMEAALASRKALRALFRCRGLLLAADTR